VKYTLQLMSNVSEARLRNAIRRAGLPSDIWARIETAVAQGPEIAAGFEAAHIAYYLGALLIIGAMGWFITSAWDALSGLTQPASPSHTLQSLGRLAYCSQDVTTPAFPAASCSLFASVRHP
jgi:hypothetical protein